MIMAEQLQITMRVDEHAKRLQQSCFGRMADICRRSSTGRGSGSRLIGEQAPLDTVHEHGAEAACAPPGGRPKASEKILLETRAGSCPDVFTIITNMVMKK